MNLYHVFVINTFCDKFEVMEKKDEKTVTLTRWGCDLCSVKFDKKSMYSVIHDGKFVSELESIHTNFLPSITKHDVVACHVCMYSKDDTLFDNIILPLDHPCITQETRFVLEEGHFGTWKEFVYDALPQSELAQKLEKLFK